LLTVDTAFTDLPRLELDRAAEQGLLLGRTVVGQIPAMPGESRLYGDGGRFLGLGEGQEGGRIKPLRLFVTLGRGGE
jgi:hypothetical protein